MAHSIAKLDLDSVRFDSLSNSPVGSARGPLAVFIGGMGAGKTHLMEKITQQYHDVRIAHVTSLDGVTSGQIERTISHQKHRLGEGGRPGMDTRAIITSDGWGSKLLQQISASLQRDLFSRAREWNIMLMVAMPQPTPIPPTMRADIDYVFIMREPDAGVKRRLYDYYAFAFFDTFEGFCAAMDVHASTDYACLVLDASSGHTVHWYKAEL